jgi:lipopolysaccharide biosynthesis protein
VNLGHNSPTGIEQTVPISEDRLEQTRLRAIAFYLPQYHPIPENDEWWGTGFTEWRNVTQAKPLFPGHYQPHLPADLGFYDLRLPEVREAQAELARSYGIHGFCYYHYWFNGRRILERPFNEVLVSGKPDFPFCLCWANENWTRAWDGGEQHILLQQHYSAEDDRAHIRTLMPAFADKRYIRVDGRPLFLVYRTELLPDPKRTAEIWREEALSSGVGEIYLARVENFVTEVDPRTIGFDAAVEFAPHGAYVGKIKFRGPFHRLLARAGLLSEAYVSGQVVNYRAMMLGMLGKPDPGYKRFRCATPMWDNTARRRNGAHVYAGSTPKQYESWLAQIATETVDRFPPEQRIVFLNAWNEWAEGCHLEPDQRWGRQYLEATKAALDTAASASTDARAGAPAPARAHPWAKRFYWRALAVLAEQRELLNNVLNRRG